MATRAILTPTSAEFKFATFPQLQQFADAGGARKVLAYDAATDEAAYWTLIAPQGWTSGFSLVLSWAAGSATTGNVVWDAAVEAITSGDAVDLDAGESLDSVNTAAAATVPGTAGYMTQTTITLTNNDSSAAGDMLRIRIRRVGSSGSDTAAGDALLYAAELRDSA